MKSYHIILIYLIIILIKSSISNLNQELSYQTHFYNQIKNYSSWIVNNVVNNYYQKEKCINFIKLNKNEDIFAVNQYLNNIILSKLHKLHNVTIIFNLINTNYLFFLKNNCYFYFFVIKSEENLHQIWLKYIPLFAKSSYKLRLLYIINNNFNNDYLEIGTKNNYESLSSEMFAHADVKILTNFTLFSTENSLKLNRKFKQVTDFEDNQELLIKTNVINGKHLRVTSFDCHPFSYLIMNQKANNMNTLLLMKKKMFEQKMCGGSIQQNCVNGDGIFAHIMLILSNYLNFTWTVVMPFDGFYGSILPNGTVDGCEGDIVSGKADIGYCDFWVQLPRHNKVEFTYPLLPTCMTFLVPRPKRLEYSWYSVFMSFQKSIWVIIIIFVLITSGILYLFNFTYRELMFLKSDSYIEYNFLKALLDVYGLLITAGQFGPKTHNLLSIHILLTWWSLMAILVTLMYSCNLVSFLTIPKYENRVDTTENFEKSNLFWGLNVMLDFESLDINRKGVTYIRKNVVMEYELNDRLENIKSDKYAVLVYRMNHEMTVLCGFEEFPTKNLRMMKECLYEPYTSMILPKNSPYQHSIDNILLRMFDVGIFQHVVKSQVDTHVPISMRSVFKENDAMNMASVKPEILTIEHIQGAFYFLFFFNIVSFIIFLTEILHFKLKNFKHRD